MNVEDISPFEPTVLGAMWKYKWLVGLIAAIFVSLAVAYTVFSPVSYRASANLVVEDPRATALFDIGNVQNPQRYVADQAAIVASSVVADRAAAETSADAGSLLEGMNVFWDGSSNLIQLTFTADDADTAVENVNAVMDAYIDVRKETSSRSFADAIGQLDDSIQDVEGQISTLQTQIEAQIEGDPSIGALDNQLSEALSRLVVLQSELAEASGSELDSLREELDDILQQIQTMQSVSNLQVQRPELSALLEEQRQRVARKADLLSRKDGLTVEARLESTGVVLADPSIVAEEVGADARRTVAVGLMLGLLAAAATAYILALRNRSFGERTQPELVLKVPLLAEVPNFRAERITGELPVRSDPASVAAESFRFIAASVDVESEQIGRATDRSDVGNGSHERLDQLNSVRSFAVVSSTLADGKTVVAANTALALARQGKRVIALDADFGNQRLSHILGGENAARSGITDLVERGVPFEGVTQRILTKDGATLDLVSRGTVRVTAPDFFRSAGVKAFFEAVKDEYDFVIIDTPPLLHVAYASPLVRFADRALVVVAHDSSVAPVEDLADRLARLETEVMGYVYNKAPLSENMARAEGSLKDVLGQTFQLNPSR